MSAKSSSLRRVPDSQCDAVMLRPCSGNAVVDPAFVVVSACALVVLSSSPAPDAELL